MATHKYDHYATGTHFLAMGVWRLCVSTAAGLQERYRRTDQPTTHSVTLHTPTNTVRQAGDLYSSTQNRKPAIP